MGKNLAIGYAADRTQEREALEENHGWFWT
jgi:hypothetical protein